MASHARDSKNEGVVAEAVATQLQGAYPDKGRGTVAIKLGKTVGQVRDLRARQSFRLVS